MPSPFPIGRWIAPHVRAGVGAAFLLAYALVSATSVVVRSARKPPRADREPALTATQVAELRALLPPRGVVGFVARETPDSSWRRNGPELVWLQHDLAPVVLALSGEHALVVVDMQPPSDAYAAGAREGLVLRRDLGGGILLFGRPHP